VPDLPERFDPRKSAQTGLDVLSHGLPALPDALTYDMSVPVAFWTATTCAVVLFLRYSKHPDEAPTPIVTMGAFFREDGHWRAHKHWGGIGFSHDPIAQPGDIRDLDGRALVIGGGGFTDQPEPGHAAAIETGRVSPAVAAIAVIQDGQEDRRPLRSHFGAWVVCLERWSPYLIHALDAAGTVLATTEGPPTLPSQRDPG
jgi:hypothetical protein